MRIDKSTTQALTLRRCSVFVVLLLGAVALTPAWAAEKSFADCTPVGTLPNHPATDRPDQYAYERQDFDVTQKDNSTQTVTVAGRFCHQHYILKDGAEPMSDLEMVSNYQAQFDQLGAKTVYRDDSTIEAVLDKDGEETWMKMHDPGGDSIDVVVVNKQPVKLSLTAPSGDDYRLLGHMPNYIGDKPDKANFDQHSFTVHSADGDAQVRVQGTRYDVHYNLKPGVQETRNIEEKANYVDALKRLGAVITYSDGSEIDARYDDNGRAIWMQINLSGSYYDVHTIEEKAFLATIKPAQAGELKAALDKDGHVALYINFDFDKATLRPDSAPVMAQVLALLKANPGLELSIVGNTDNVGGHDYNVKLSQQRAAAVVATLVKDGIAATRLKSSGDGPDKPIADNDSSDGRAKNRRVELVKG